MRCSTWQAEDQVNVHTKPYILAGKILGGISLNPTSYTLLPTLEYGEKGGGGGGVERS